MSRPELTYRQIVECEKNTILVSGKPGSGKTNLIVRRFLHLVQDRLAPLSSILVFTFSSVAAVRLRRRLEAELRRSYDELWIHTYHSFGRVILEEYAAIAPLSNPVIFVSPFREYLLVKELLSKAQPELSSFLKDIALKDGAARELSDFFGLLKQSLIEADEFSTRVQGLSGQLSDIARIYSKFETYKKERGWFGLRDVIPLALEAADRCPTLVSRYHGKFSHILIDEIEEADTAQLSLIKHLASPDASLFATGDEDQRIFRFRGSTIRQFDRLAEERAETTRFRLDSSFRLPPSIEAGAANLIAQNRERREETVNLSPDYPCNRKFSAGDCAPGSGAIEPPDTFTVPLGPGEDSTVASYSDAVEQAYSIAREIKCRVLDSSGGSDAVSYSDFAVLCRSASRSGLAFEEAFSYYDIPYVLYNNTSFLMHPMVNWIVDFIRLLANPDDDRLLLRVLRNPAFRVNPIAMRKIANRNEGGGSPSLYQALRQTILNADSAPGIADTETDGPLREFMAYFEDFRQKARVADCPSSLIHSIMSRSFYRRIIENDDRTAGVRDAADLRRVYEVVVETEDFLKATRGKCSLFDIADYMEHAFAYFSSLQENDPVDELADGVKIMTVHQAKGMEFPFVFLVDMTEENFPRLVRATAVLDERTGGRLAERLAISKKPASQPHEKLPFLMTVREQLSEERQLVYVAMTRASKRLAISFPQESHRSDPVLPSPFIDEFLGKPIAEYPVNHVHSGDDRDARELLKTSLNQLEIESAVRTLVHGRHALRGDMREFSEFLESLGLDAHFICAENPFPGEPPRTVHLADHRYSASQLATYLSCPRRFFFERILRIAPDRPEDFGLGQLVHAVLERFHTNRTRFDEDPCELEKKLLDTLREVWGEGAVPRGQPKIALWHQFPTAIQRATIERRAENILRRYIRTEIDKARGRSVVACEQFIDFRIGDHKFVAKIDRIDSGEAGHHIIDYKTAAGGPMGAATIKKKFLNVEGKVGYSPQDFQFPLYLLACRSAGYNPVEISYYWLGGQDASGRFKRSGLCVGDHDAEALSAKDMEDVEKAVSEIVATISAARFEPQPRSAYECGRCSFQFLCDPENEDGPEHNEP